MFHEIFPEFYNATSVLKYLAHYIIVISFACMLLADEDYLCLASEDPVTARWVLEQGGVGAVGLWWFQGIPYDVEGEDEWKEVDDDSEEQVEWSGDG